MITRKIQYICWISLTLVLLSLDAGAEDTAPPLYMGEEPPGLIPKVFAPDVISIPNRFERNITFTADGREYYFNTRNSSWTAAQILETHYENGQWTTPVRASFSDNTSLCPSLADNDQTIYFTGGSTDIYRASRTATGWSDPVRLAEPISSDQAEYSVHISSLGNLWMCSHRPGGRGGCDVWRIPLENGQFGEPLNLRILNTSGNDCAPVPAHNEDFVIWMANRPGGFGINDLYISFTDGQGAWKAPQNLGPMINTPVTECAPFISPDQKYLFFTRETGATSDIYWVSVDAFLPDPNGPVLNLTTGRRYAAIQAAVNFADSGDTLVLQPGTYHESVILKNRDLIIQSVDPTNPIVTAVTVIHGDEQQPVVQCIANTANCKLRGLTLTKGQTGLDIDEASPRIENCCIIDNTGHGIQMQAKSDPGICNTLICANGETGILMTEYSSIDGVLYNEPLLMNCTIADNGQEGIKGGKPTLRNTIVYGNGLEQLAPVSATVSYSCIQGGFAGNHTMDADPMFLVPGNYHLHPASPCIDAGDPNDAVRDEPVPNGGVVNMGAYGGTQEAMRATVQ